MKQLLFAVVWAFMLCVGVANAAVGDPQDRTRLGAVLASDTFTSLTTETTCDGKGGRYDVQGCPYPATVSARTLGGAQCYGDALTPALLTLRSGGGVTLAAVSKPGAGVCASTAYRSAWLSTYASFATFKTGYIEARAIMPSCGHAHWPALWLMPAGGKWTGEIDFGEVALDGLTYAIHANEGAINIDGHLKLTKACDGGSHTYGVLIQPAGPVIWYFDRVEVAEATPPVGLVDTKWFFIANLGVTPGSFAGAADAQSAPASMILQSWIAYALAK